MAGHGKTGLDVRFVAIRPYFNFQKDQTWKVGSWWQFARLADNPYPTSHWNGEEVQSSDIEMGLMIVGDDWWMERGLNDELGLTWWEFKTIPTIPEQFNRLSNLFDWGFEIYSQRSKHRYGV